MRREKGKEAGTSLHLRNSKRSGSAGVQLCEEEQWEIRCGLESGRGEP